MGMSGLWWDDSSSDLTLDCSNKIWREKQFCELVQGDAGEACKFGGLAAFLYKIWREKQFCELLHGDAGEAFKFGGLVAFFLVQHVWMTLVEFWFHLVNPCQLKMM